MHFASICTPFSSAGFTLSLAVGVFRAVAHPYAIVNHKIPYAGEWVGLRFPRKDQVIAALTVQGGMRLSKTLQCCAKREVRALNQRAALPRGHSDAGNHQQ